MENILEMVKLYNSCFCLFGNPVHHSFSPEIHTIFSNQININYFYKTVLVSKENLKNSIKNFFVKKYNLGANVTVPFKKEIIKYLDNLTERAKISRSVNTIKKINNKFLLGDNTDGVGLLYDLNRLNFLRKKNNILIIGSGGAAYGIVPNLISKKNLVYIYNRTNSKSKKLVKYFKKFGNIFCLKRHELKKYCFNLVINATSSGIFNEIPDVPNSIISKNTYCYDLYFNKEKYTPFLKMCKKNGAINLKNGIGMLVSQAAYSCFLWHKKFPNIENTIITLNKKINL